MHSETLSDRNYGKRTRPKDFAFAAYLPIAGQDLSLWASGSSVEAYRATLSPGHPRPTVLRAKSACKDRRRQVLAEAAKIPRKHLLTLEPGISGPQTTQMANSNLQLVARVGPSRNR